MKIHKWLKNPCDIVDIVEIPSYIFNLLVMDRWGRKPIFASAFILTGVTAVPAAFLEEGTLRTILALAGKQDQVKNQIQLTLSLF